jgi:hypothetical protein
MTETPLEPAADQPLVAVPVAFQDPMYLAAVVDLLAAVAYG